MRITPPNKYCANTPGNPQCANQYRVGTTVTLVAEPARLGVRGLGRAGVRGLAADVRGDDGPGHVVVRDFRGPQTLP